LRPEPFRDHIGSEQKKFIAQSRAAYHWTA
jgi:hypothetical protein